MADIKFVKCIKNCYKKVYVWNELDFDPAWMMMNTVVLQIANYVCCSKLVKHAHKKDRALVCIVVAWCKLGKAFCFKDVGRNNDAYHYNNKGTWYVGLQSFVLLGESY